MLKYKFHFPKYGEVEVLSLWIKGKTVKPNNVRFLVNIPSSANSNLPTLQMLWIDEHFVTGVEWQGSYVDQSDYKTPQHIKLGSYNYYFESDDEDTVRDAFDEIVDEYKAGVTKLPKNLNSYIHVPANQVNYTLIEAV